MTSAIVSALHLLAMALGVSSVFARARALRGPLDAGGLRRLFAADNAWGIAAVLLLATGLLRAFAGLEKGSAFYLASAMFYTKLTLFGVVFALEIWPMTTFIRWRRQLGRGEAPDTSRGRTFFLISHVQMALVVVIVLVASVMARGVGLR